MGRKNHRSGDSGICVHLRKSVASLSAVFLATVFVDVELRETGTGISPFRPAAEPSADAGTVAGGADPGP